MLVSDFSVKKWLQAAFLISYVTSYAVSDNNGSGCHLPQHPDFGNWSVYNSSFEWSPGMEVPSGTILLITCQDKFVLEGIELIVCVDEKWLGTIGRCLAETCPPLYNTSLMTVTCFNNSREDIVDCTKAPHGTKVEFECAKFYEARELETRPPTVCIGRRWNNKVPKCVPVCGRKKSRASTSIRTSGGTQVTIEDYPWQAAMYATENRQFKCGGTLLNQQLVLTAAHCVSDDGTPYSVDVYEVAVGKYYRKYDDSRDFQRAQFSSIRKIFIPQRYRDYVHHYNGDLAVIATTRKFVLSDIVQPICIDWSASYDEKFRDPNEGQFGYVVGWGYTAETGAPSDVLREVKVPPVDRETCKRQFPEGYRQFVTADKMCAGFLNKSTAVCKGDSGGGLVFEYNNRYYVAGVVSTSPRPPSSSVEHCDFQQYALYTLVSYYSEYFIPMAISTTENFDQVTNLEAGKPITQRITHTALSSGMGCILPEHPEFGKWILPEKIDQQSLLPGQFVGFGTRLLIECQEHHIIVGSRSVFCYDESWTSALGRCQKTCPPLFSTQAMKVVCFDEDGKSKSCDVGAVDGTFARFECAPYYENLASNRDPLHVCMNGRWDHGIPACNPVCGQVEDDEKEDALFPWHVAIYNKTTKDIICSGSLINERVILTTAHCVADSIGNLKPKTDFIVTVGNHYRRFNDTRDKDYIQVSALHDLFLPDQYKKSKEAKEYFADIAVLAAENKFVMTERVQPVCFNNAAFFTSAEYGYFVGWGHNIDKAKPADVLAKVKIPLSARAQECPNDKKIVPKGYESYNTSDKICASFMDNSALMCFGDTGAGVVYKYEGRYHLGGIVGLSANTPRTVGACDRQTFVTISLSESYLLNFILEKEALFSS